MGLIFKDKYASGDQDMMYYKLVLNFNYHKKDK
jgi:hypothetical protein